jgi:UDP-N-acetylglucosamine 2-epimerase
MARTENPFGDGQAGKRIVRRLVEHSGLLRVA